ncbi:PTS sugar transporter subunit IIB [Listeria marthii]|uniref:PTS sugar transporter subunit IIB n=1 Tax=Listeria marthii TaxID=529731 RepID=UPI001625238F|nr:PTS sugar transporter subunit IIB [Listeria marthii]MBC2000600.1 PTS sugar transporter subunit IIB [Listeria marthii]MBC2039416.1 PTS sugar transporter subunit IIB [Listeria marthii]MCD2254120.1 PTS sugar transporter subunit IIB [Listeria marthii]
MKILAVCGLGQGTSLILRMNVETVLRDMGVDADVEHIDVSAARSMNVDIIVTSQELAETLGTDTGAKVVIVNNYFDNAEIKNALSTAINS